MRNAALLIFLALATTISGCASFSAPSYSADYSALDSLKRAGAGKASVGKVEPQDPNAKVNHITLRASALNVSGGTFSNYLENALISDLTEAGRFDANSKKHIDIVLVRNNIDISGISTGTGDIAIDLTISESGKTLLQKNYSASKTFESSFAGAVAIPKGQAEYPNLVRELLAQVYADQAFIQAMR
jgi:hypothetical protein